MPIIFLLVAEIINIETETMGKEPFRLDEFPELVKLEYATNLTIKSNDEMLSEIQVERFMMIFKFQRLNHAIAAMNRAKA